MSHFAVLVIGDDIEGQLEPYQKNNMGDCPAQYLEFTDETDSIHDEYNNGSRTKLFKGEEEVGYWDAEIKALRIAQGHKASDIKFIPEGCHEVSTPWKEIYPTLEAFVKEYYGYDKPAKKSSDPEHIKAGRKNRYGYTSNPNSKWDWYQIGGRWAGNLLLKPEFASERQTPDFSWGWSEEEKQKILSEPRTDQAILEHIDIDAMIAERKAELKEQYDLYLLREKLVRMTKKELLDFVSEQDKEVEPFKSIWNLQPKEGSVEVTLEEIINKLNTVVFGFFSWTREEKYDFAITHTLEEFIEKYYKHPLITFAIVKDGEWYERGEMGWWACVSNEMSKEDWDKKFAELIGSLDPETLITLVDCHV